MFHWCHAMHESCIPVFPNGCKIALCVNVMYEKWAPGTWPQIGPMGNPISSSVVDYQALSWSDYGYQTGVWRIREQLALAQVCATVFVSGILTEVAPDSLLSLRDGGHEIAAHAWSQDQLIATLPVEAEREVIKRCQAALSVLLGDSPRGWISPRCTPSQSTPELLAEAGFFWWGDVFDADEPYKVETSAGQIIAYPFQTELNDLPHRVRYGRSNGDLLLAWHEELNAVRHDPRPHWIDMTIHAHISGRTSGLEMLRNLLDEANADPDIWIATKSQVLEAYSQRHLRQENRYVDNE